MDDEIFKLKNAIDMAENIVVLGGAGFSTESGIPDFRSPDGIYNKYKDINPEEILSAGTLRDKPELFFDFFVNVMLTEGTGPNIAHFYFAELEQTTCKHITIITQNIDGLHQKAGSKNVIELHGSADEYYCVRCGDRYDSRIMDKTKFSGDPLLPRCIKCGSMVRPDVTMYQESLDAGKLYRARKEMQDAELVIIGGTSLEVYPANALLRFCSGAEIFVINREQINTSRFVRDENVTFIKRSLGAVFGELTRLAGTC